MRSLTPEKVFVHVGRLLIQWPKLAMSLLALCFVITALQLPKLRIDTSAESFLLPNHPLILNFDEFRNEFGRDEFFVVVVSGMDVFSLDSLAALRDFHLAIEKEVGNLQSVESLVNVRSIYGSGDDLIAEDLLETFPESEEDLAVIRERIRGKDIYYDRLINRDEDTIAIMVKLLPFTIIKNADGSETRLNMGDAQIAHASDEIRAVADRFEPRFHGGKVYIGGTPAMGSYLSQVIQKDFGIFTAIAILMVGLVLAVLFRRASGVLIPLTIMVIAIVYCIGVMPILGFPIQITTSILPTFLLAVCVGDAVHLLTFFYRHYDEGATKEAAILYALGHTGTPVLFTTLTTMAGLATFLISDIQPVVSLGLFSAIGTAVAFFLTIITLPVLIMLSPIRRKVLVPTEEKVADTGWFHRMTRFSIWLTTQHPWKIVLFSLTVFVVALVQVPGLRFSQDSLGWLPVDNPVRQAIYKIEEKITGSTPVEVVIDTGQKQGALDPVFLKRVDQWISGIRGKEMAGVKVISVNSLVDMVKETNQAFNGNTPAAYRIPDDRELVAQELLMIEMDEADDLYAFTDRDFSKLRITVIVPWHDAVVYEKFLDHLAADYQKVVGSEHAMHFTGITPIFSELLTAMMYSASKSYLLAGMAILLMMALMLRSAVDGFLAIIPNLIPIVATIAFMVLVDMPMDVFTVLIGSIAMGICVDDTIHFMHGFKTSLRRQGSAAVAIDETLTLSGRALIMTSVVLFWGFLTFTLSDLSGMRNFSSMMALCIALALVSNFLLCPALMMLRYGRK